MAPPPQEKVITGLSSEQGAEHEGAELTEFEHRTIRLFVDAAGVLGVPKSIAMIYGVLFGSVDPLNFAEIEQKLQLSKGSVSQGLRVLRDMGAVQPVDEGDEAATASQPGRAGSTAVSYEPVVELRVLLSRIIADKVQPHLQASGAAIDDLTALLPKKTADSAVLDTRLRHLRAWQKRSHDLMPLLRAFLS